MIRRRDAQSRKALLLLLLLLLLATAEFTVKQAAAAKSASKWNGMAARSGLVFTILHAGANALHASPLLCRVY